MTRYANHVESYKPTKHVHKCVVCGEDCYTYCGLCEEYMHKQTNRGKHGDKICDIKWHNDSFFGLAKKDHQVHLKKSRNTYNNPTPTEEFDQREHIKSFQRARLSEVRFLELLELLSSYYCGYEVASTSFKTSYYYWK